MFYPYIEKQTKLQWVLNTIDPRVWFRHKYCECSWQLFQGKIMWIILGGCPNHD